MHWMRLRKGSSVDGFQLAVLIELGVIIGMQLVHMFMRKGGE
jgi:hypothetical protein